MRKFNLSKSILITVSPPIIPLVRIHVNINVLFLKCSHEIHDAVVLRSEVWCITLIWSITCFLVQTYTLFKELDIPLLMSIVLCEEFFLMS